MPFTVIDGINTRYEVLGSGPPLLMFSRGGFDGTLEKSLRAAYCQARLSTMFS